MRTKKTMQILQQKKIFLKRYDSIKEILTASIICYLSGMVTTKFLKLSVKESLLLFTELEEGLMASLVKYIDWFYFVKCKFVVALKRISVDMIDEKARDKCLKEVNFIILLI